jgi:hypothetical protein|tara:strand:+ start:747 stop:953 length:207 start_codon:yes stop_codon:yes gene_type:complete
MTADVTETMDQDKLLGQFRDRYQALINQNKELTQQIKNNEAQALKLLGAIETLEYLNPPEEEEEAPAE